MRHLQNNHTDLVILHLIYQLRHQPFCLLQAAWLYVLCQHGIGYIQRNHHFHSLAFYRLQFGTKLRTCQQYREQPDSRKNQPKLHIRTVFGNIRH